MKARHITLFLGVFSALIFFSCDMGEKTEQKPEPAQYTVTFDKNHSDSNGWTNANPATITVTGAETVTLPEEPTRTGYLFVAWYDTTAATGGTEFTEGTTVSANKTVYARWAEPTRPRYTVTFDKNHTDPSGWINANPAARTITYPAIVTLPAEPTRTGYTFIGWYDTAATTGGNAFTGGATVNENKTVYARWTVLYYNLVVASATGQGAWGSAQITSGTGTENSHGTSVTVQATAADGYVFEKWSDNAAGTTQVSTDNPYTFAITQNTTLYAVFSPPPGGTRMVQTISGVDIPFRYVPAGSFQRDKGGNENPAQKNDGDITVITKGYWMAETETTQQLFLAVMETNPSNFPNNPDGGETQNRRPVEKVTWYDAIAFCNKLSLVDGREPVYSVKVSGVEVNWAGLIYAQIPTSDNADWNAVTMNRGKNGYRLPTEMEWMWAAMGADRTSRPNTTGYLKAFAGSDGSNSVDDYVWYNSNSDSKTHEAGKKQANELGLYDMSGNVSEWCWDWAGTSYNSGSQSDPEGEFSGVYYRVHRGGSWHHSPDNVRSASRNSDRPAYRQDRLGFRLVHP